MIRAAPGILRHAVGILAVGSVVVSAAPLVATWWWIFDLFTHFRIQLIGVQICLAAICLIARRPGWSAVVAVTAVLNAYSIRDYLVPSSIGAAARAAGTSVTLMSANIQGRGRDLGGLLELIELESPDIVVIEEYHDRTQRQASALARRYPHRLEVPRSDPWGIALFSKYPLLDASEFGLGRTSGIDARIDLGDAAMRVIGVHLSSPMTAESTAARSAELSALARRAESASEPLIVVGDFNVSPFSPYFEEFTDETGLRDSLAGRGPGITWPTFLPLMGIPIDHCLVSDDWRIVDYRRLPAIDSDHYPIVIELQHQSLG